jgi:hypothetical protein
MCFIKEKEIFFFVRFFYGKINVSKIDIIQRDFGIVTV